MKNSGRYTFALFIILNATSFTSPMIEDKATEFTANGVEVILESSVKEIISTRLFIKNIASSNAEESIDSAYYGNYRISGYCCLFSRMNRISWRVRKNGLSGPPIVVFTSINFSRPARQTRAKAIAYLLHCLGRF